MRLARRVLIWCIGEVVSGPDLTPFVYGLDSFQGISIITLVSGFASSIVIIGYVKVLFLN